MAVYGVTPEGFNRKPLEQIIADIEAALLTEVPGLIQTPQSPQGQLNRVFADILREQWEYAEDDYQSYDPNQAEDRGLDRLGKIRLISRTTEESNELYRQAITNFGQARVDLQDIARAIKNVAGITYAQIFLNESTAPDENQLPPGTICIAALGGDDEEIAAEMRRYIVPGISTFGNVYVSTVIEGFCRSIAILRPILVPVTLTINVRVTKDIFGCPPPAPTAIRDALLEDFAYNGRMALLNGHDITYFRVRSVIESRFPNVEVLSFTAIREDYPEEADPPEFASIAFIEIASLTSATVTVDVV